MTETNTDYDLPLDWKNMTDHEKNKWLFKERNRRQAARQGTTIDNKSRYD